MKASPDRNKSGGFLAHYVLSAGGSRAILAGCGSALACHMAGLEYASIGGVSGGSLPAILLAAGMKPADFLRIALDVDFREMCENKAGKFESLLAILMKEYHEHPENRTGYGIYDTDKLGKYIESHVTSWPDKFWTMAVDGHTQILFSKDGVFEKGSDGRWIQLSNQPAPIGLAIQATCAIPGLMKPTVYQGRHLYDGAFTKDGICPVRVPVSFFGAKYHEVIGCSTGEDIIPGFTGKFLRWWKWFWKIQPDTSWGVDTADVIDIRPGVHHIHALRFDLSRDEKWLAIIDGFSSTIHELADHGLLTGQRHKDALELLSALPSMKGKELAKIDQRQVLTERAEHHFARHGLY